jgi:hypothetical protein
MSAPVLAMSLLFLWLLSFALLFGICAWMDKL